MLVTGGRGRGRRGRQPQQGAPAGNGAAEPEPAPAVDPSIESAPEMIELRARRDQLCVRRRIIGERIAELQKAAEEGMLLIKKSIILEEQGGPPAAEAARATVADARLDLEDAQERERIIGEAVQEMEKGIGELREKLRHRQIPKLKEKHEPVVKAFCQTLETLCDLFDEQELIFKVASEVRDGVLEKLKRLPVVLFPGENGRFQEVNRRSIARLSADYQRAGYSIKGDSEEGEEKF